jgi:hypothetical protein
VLPQAAATIEQPESAAAAVAVAVGVLADIPSAHLKSEARAAAKDSVGLKR